MRPQKHFATRKLASEARQGLNFSKKLRFFRLYRYDPQLQGNFRNGLTTRKQIQSGKRET
ncbi:MAG: hypothetical protein ACRBB6_16790, partial [Neptuniibacter sp.]